MCCLLRTRLSNLSVCLALRLDPAAAFEDAVVEETEMESNHLAIPRGRGVKELKDPD